MERNNSNENIRYIKEQRIRYEKRRKRYKNIMALILCAIATIIIAIILKHGYDYYYGNADTDKDNDPNAVIGQLEGKTPDEVQKELDRVVKETSMVISINSKIQMEKGSSLAPLRIENTPNNHYIIQVSIILNNSNKMIYNSGLIEPNYHIERAKLNKSLPKGNYDAVAIFSAYNLKTKKYVGQQKANITIEVKS